MQVNKKDGIDTSEVIISDENDSLLETSLDTKEMNGHSTGMSTDTETDDLRNERDDVFDSTALVAPRRSSTTRQASSLSSGSYELYVEPCVSSSSKTKSPRGSESFQSIDTFTSAVSRSSPQRGFGTFMREDSFDRKKLNYLSTSIADTKMERAKIIGVNEYTFLKTLGKGAFAEVKLATKSKIENNDLVHDLNVDNFERYAIKIVKKNFLQEKRKLQSSRDIQFRPNLVVEETKKKSIDSLLAATSTPGSSRSKRMQNKKFRTDKSELNGSPSVDTSPNPPSSTPETVSIKHPQPAPVAEEVLQEIEILKFLRHKNLVKLCEIIDDPQSKYLYIVMEYIPFGPIMIRDSSGGNFYSRLTGGVLLESTASRIFKDLMNVLEYLHLNHIAHRDLKPDNLLVDLAGNLKVSDFGVSSYFSEEKRKEAVNMKQLSRSKSRGVVSNTEGTFAFYSPEMCRENAGSYSAYMSDVWAASVCLWILIFGELPWYTADIVDLFSLIRHNDPIMPHGVSPELAHLFSKVLAKKQDQRLSIHDIQNHCWLKRSPLQGNRGSTDNYDIDNCVDNVTYEFSPALRRRIHRWAEGARSRCAERTEKFAEDLDRELISMLRRSSIPFKDEESEHCDDEGHSSDDDDPLARLVSYDEINGSVLDDIKKHEEKRHGGPKLSSLDEGDEGRSPVQVTPPRPKKSYRQGRKSKLDVNEYLQRKSSSASSSDNIRPTLEVHERLTQEAIVALELEAFTLSTNKKINPDNERLTSCCNIS